MTTALREISLNDKYTALTGKVLLKGNQALVRALLVQHELDRRAALAAEFDGQPVLRFNLAPPLLAKRDPATGHLLKREVGAWMLTAMRWLARARPARHAVRPVRPQCRTAHGTRLDRSL